MCADYGTVCPAASFVSGFELYWAHIAVLVYIVLWVLETIKDVLNS